MKRRVLTLAAMGLFTSIAVAEPTIQPATKPVDVWTTDDLGRLVFHQLATAPYPHPSRADGWTNSAGTVFTSDHYTDSTVGIFVPRGFTPGNATDFIFYFHGHNNHVSRVIDTFKLEEQIVKSGVNAILVVPQGPLDVPDSGGGKLEHDDDGFKRLVVDVSTYLEAEGITHNNHVGNIVLAAHSGGYNVTASIIHRGGLTDLIRDVFLFDASYGGLQWFADFAISHPASRIISFHTKHLDDRNVALAGLLEKGRAAHRGLAEADVSAKTLGILGVTLISTTLTHNEVPSGKDYFALCLQSSPLTKIPEK